MQPLFSIITVTYNAADTVKATIDSVTGQSCKLYEHIIIDGKSTDKTVEVINQIKDKNRILVSEKDNGLYDAMNKGLGLATGDYVIFLNAGDTFHSSDTLAEFADVIMDNDYPGIVYGQTNIVDRNGRYLRQRHLTAPEILTLDSFKDGMMVCHQAFVVLRKLTNNFNTRYRFSADYEWCIRCLQRSHRNFYIDATVIDYLDEGVTKDNHIKSLYERFKIMSYYYGIVPTLLVHLKKMIHAVIAH